MLPTQQSEHRDKADTQRKAEAHSGETHGEGLALPSEAVPCRPRL